VGGGGPFSLGDTEKEVFEVAEEGARPQIEELARGHVVRE
jgi:hypothetical protein